MIAVAERNLGRQRDFVDTACLIVQSRGENIRDYTAGNIGGVLFMMASEGDGLKGYAFTSSSHTGKAYRSALRKGVEGLESRGFKVTELPTTNVSQRVAGIYFERGMAND